MSLRKEIIRLAHTKPELREHLLPLVTTQATKTSASRSSLPILKAQWWSDIGSIVEQKLNRKHPNSCKFTGSTENGVRFLFYYGNTSKGVVFGIEDTGEKTFKLISDGKLIASTIDRNREPKEIITNMVVLYEFTKQVS